MRARRRSQRELFDEVADRYQATRRGYPSELVRFIVETARLEPGSAVLEVGCGTGQLTDQLAAYGLAVTAIDIGNSMIAAARQRVSSPLVSFQSVSFEAFAAPDAAFDAIVSATAFHWIDPEVKFAQSARLLKAGGWLALIATGESYDDPLGAALEEMWTARCNDAGVWDANSKPTATDLSGATGLFGPPVEGSHCARIVLPTETVLGVETTRATFLSWPDHVRQGFIGDLRRYLQTYADVPLTQRTWLAMAQVRRGG